MQLLYLSDLQRPSGCFSFGKSTDDGYSEFKNTHITADLAIHWNSAEVNAITVGFRSFQDAPEHHFVITLLIQIYLFLGFRLHFECWRIKRPVKSVPAVSSDQVHQVFSPRSSKCTTFEERSLYHRK